jgi:hypothetical protein
MKKQKRSVLPGDLFAYNIPDRGYAFIFIIGVYPNMFGGMRINYSYTYVSSSRAHGDIIDYNCVVDLTLDDYDFKRNWPKDGWVKV